MDRDKSQDEQEAFVADEKPVLDESGSSNGGSIGLGWRVVVMIIALIIVALLAYPYIQDQLLTPPANSNTSVSSPETDSSSSSPEATAQANPDSAEAQFELGNSYVRSGQLEAAQAAYQQAIELNPDYQAAYANLGVVYYQLQELDLAAVQYEKALELDPNDGEVAYNLGALYLQQALGGGEQPDPELLDQAIDQIKQAMELNPDLAEPYFSLGVAYGTLNRKEDAIEAFQTFLERDTGQDPRAKQEAERYLQILRGQ